MAPKRRLSQTNAIPTTSRTTTALCTASFHPGDRVFCSWASGTTRVYYAYYKARIVDVQRDADGNPTFYTVHYYGYNEGQDEVISAKEAASRLVLLVDGSREPTTSRSSSIHSEAASRPNTDTNAGTGIDSTTTETTSLLLQCKECEGHFPHIDIYYCLNDECVMVKEKKRRLTSTASSSQEPESSGSELRKWSPKKLCPRCALANHRRHNLASREELADGRCVVKSLEGVRRWEDALDEEYRRKSEKYGDLLKPVIALYKAEFGRVYKKLQPQSGQPNLSREVLEAEYARLTKARDQAKAFISDNETLETLLKEFTERTTAVYLGSHRSTSSSGPSTSAQSAIPSPTL